MIFFWIAAFHVFEYVSMSRGVSICFNEYSYYYVCVYRLEKGQLRERHSPICHSTFYIVRFAIVATSK
jgi:hypothetical protein